MVDEVSPAPRSYVDLDLLVEPQALAAAVVALEAGDFTVLNANWPLVACVQHLRLLDPSGGAVDGDWIDQAPAVGGGRLVGGPGVARRARSLVLDRAKRGPRGGPRRRRGGHWLIWCPDVRALRPLGDRARGRSARPALQLMVTHGRRALGTDVLGPPRVLAAVGIGRVDPSGALAGPFPPARGR